MENRASVLQELCLNEDEDDAIVKWHFDKGGKVYGQL